MIERIEQMLKNLGLKRIFTTAVISAALTLYATGAVEIERGVPHLKPQCGWVKNLDPDVARFTQTATILAETYDMTFEAAVASIEQGSLKKKLQAVAAK